MIKSDEVNREKKNLSLLYLLLFIITALIISCSGPQTEQVLSQPGNIPQWQVGQWAEYEVHQGSSQLSIKYTIVDKIVEQDTLFWVESVVKTESDSFLWQALVPEYFNGTPAELVIVDLTQKEWEALAMPLGRSCRSTFLLGNFNPENLRKLGFETDYINTPAGEFYCLHCRLSINQLEADVWISGAIPILGIAKWESSDQVRTLTAYGKEGRSILPVDIVRKQISPADFSKPVFKENLISFVRVNIEDSTKVDTLSSSPAPDSL
ncbi:MAG: hypothetical protein APR63_04260 [Desulfuromonas sp. SDB]|nr:MAG: hypothetical protein APR63_04260 [Desulfuromonas sp. SDB]